MNRIDDVIIFNNLEKNDISKIIDLELANVYDRIAKIGYKVELSPEAKEFIIEKGWDKNFGARQLKRAIQKYVEDVIAEEIINSSIHDGDHLYIGLNKEKDSTDIKVMEVENESPNSK